VSDFPKGAVGAGSVRYIDPDSLNKNPAFTNVVVVEGNVKTVYIGGQDAVDASGEIVGKDDIVAQTEQILANLRGAGGWRCETRAYRQVEHLCSRGATAAGWLRRVSERLARDAQPAGHHGSVRLGSCAP
jgi:hypothetical protein